MIRQSTLILLPVFQKNPLESLHLRQEGGLDNILGVFNQSSVILTHPTVNKVSGAASIADLECSGFREGAKRLCGESFCQTRRNNRRKPTFFRKMGAPFASPSYRRLLSPECHRRGQHSRGCGGIRSRCTTCLGGSWPSGTAGRCIRGTRSVSLRIAFPTTSGWTPCRHGRRN
jgi:hypothetical protein